MKKYRKVLAIICCLVLLSSFIVFDSTVQAASTTIDKCDSATGWAGSDAVTLDTANKKEGTGCLTKTGSGTDWFKKTFSPAINSGVTESNGYVHLWLYVSDAAKLAATGAQLEITSSGGPDVNEYSWNLMSAGLVTGWNELTLKISNATKTGTPDLTAINFIRVYYFLTASITCKLDDVYFTDGAAAMPDLVVTNITWSPASPQAGNAVTFSATVKNQGNASTPAGTIIGVGFQLDGAATSLWSDNYTSSLAPGSSVVLTVNGGTNGSTWTAASGNHSVAAIVDDVNRITESNEANNTFTQSVTVGGGSSELRNAKIVNPTYATSDVIIADYDVTDYGADKTGVADSTSAIQNAIDDCYNFGGGTVWMPAGIYKVMNTIQVKAFVTLRGDWKDPDTGGGTYGTVVSAQLASGANGPSLFKIGGSAGVVGVTTYYPNQSATSPVAYNYTFLIPGRAWVGEQNYMASSVINCTLLNSYKGIGISTAASDHGGNVADGQVHETATIRNVKGTVLNQGAAAYNGADVGTWEHVIFNNSYWANAGSTYNAPGQATLNAYTRANATAFVFGDLEWEHFYDLRCSDFNVGMNIVAGQRAQFVGEFYGCAIQNTDTAIKVDGIDTRWDYPMALARCTVSGSSNAIVNNTGKKIEFTDCTITGAYDSAKVTVQNPGTSPTSYTERTTVPRTSRAVLYDVSKAPYNAPSTSSVGITLPTADATTAIQAALNDAGAAGGGVVYLQAGWYRVNTHLTVPANVELRGCSSVPNRDQTGRSAGTVLFAYEGAGTAAPDTDTAFITLNAGNQCVGVSGLRVFYPNNNPVGGAVAKYPYSIRGNGSNVYIVNVGFPNTYHGIDLSTNRCDNHFVRKVFACAFAKGIAAGLSNEGWIEGVLTNANMCCRVGYGITGWILNDTAAGSGYGGDGGAQLGGVIAYTRANEKLLTVNGSSNEHFLCCFAYGPNTGLTVTSGTAAMFNFGTDNVNSYGMNVSGGTVQVCNYARYNGATSTGAVTIYNPMILIP